MTPAAKTLHLTNAYHATSGGIRTFYRALLREANNQQRPMRLVVPGERDEIEAVGRFGLVYHLAADPAPAFDRRYRFLWPAEYVSPRNARIAAILRREQPDLVEICDKYSLFYLAAVLRKRLLKHVRRPVLVGLSCERMDDNIAAYLHDGRAARRFVSWYVRHIYGPPFDYHVANSAYTADELRECLRDRAADFIQTAPMGVDVARFDTLFRDTALRRELLGRAGGTNWSVLLFYAGRLAPEKNVGLLIDTLERLIARRKAEGGRDYRLVLAGDGPLAADLRAAADTRVPGRVLFLGPITDQNRLAAHYASADLFVHPNPREPFGIGPLEAMASGVPVVVPDAGGVLSYASHDNAWLAAPDAAAFADAIRQATTHPDRNRILHARRTACAHDWPCVAAAWFSLYDRLIRRHDLTATPAHRAVDPDARGVVGVRAALCAGAQPAGI